MRCSNTCPIHSFLSPDRAAGTYAARAATPPALLPGAPWSLSLLRDLLHLPRRDGRERLAHAGGTVGRTGPAAYPSRRGALGRQHAAGTRVDRARAQLQRPRDCAGTPRLLAGGQAGIVWAAGSSASQAVLMPGRFVYDRLIVLYPGGSSVKEVRRASDS